jgi:hypothetical protein
MGESLIDEWAIDNHWSWLDYDQGSGLEVNGGFLEEISGGTALPTTSLPPGRNGPNDPLISHVNGPSDSFPEVFDAKSSLRGIGFPRISPISYRSLDYSRGNALIAWARDVLGVELMPWQQFLLRESLVMRDGVYRYRTILAVVARQNGKTLVTAVRVLGGICLLGEPSVLGSAHTRVIGMEALELAYQLALDAGLPTQKIRRAAGQEEFRVAGGRYKLTSATTQGARGYSGVNLVVIDELRQMSHWEPYAALDKTRRTKRTSQLWTITTEGDISSVVLNKLQTIGRDAIEAGQDSPVGYFEWSAPPGMHAGDVRAWAHANPALGYLLDEDTVRAEFQTDPPRVFEVEVLCRKVSQITGWVEPAEWEACITKDQFPIDQPFVLAVDAVPELRHVSIVAGALVGRVHHIELVETFTGPMALEHAEQRLDGLLSRWRPAALVTTQKSPCEPSVAKLAATANITHSAVRPAEWARACRAFYAAVRGRQVSHPGGTGISAALALTKRGPDGLVSQVHRINDSADNDAALAAVLALWAPTQLKSEPALAWTIY